MSSDLIPGTTRQRKASLKRLAWTAVSVSLLMGSGRSTVWAASDASAAPATQPADPDSLLATIRDTKLDAARRRQAVNNLLDQYRQHGVTLLAGELLPIGEPTTQQVIVQAIASRTDEPPPELAAPVFSLLDRSDEAFTMDLVALLRRFEDTRFIKRLSDTAADANAPAQRRRGAILALGVRRTQSTAKLLIQLIQPNQSATVRGAALVSLADLTGLAEFGSDTAKWQQWWDQNRHLDEDEWLQLLLNNHVKRSDRNAAENRQLQDRVIELQRQLYRATAQDARPALLVNMLADPTESCRQLAIDLIVQRLTDAQPVNAPVREALLARLDDPSAAIRQGTARVLRELADAGGADAVAKRLVAGRESDPGVLKAYLLVLARVPRQDAIETGINLLGNAEVVGEASAMVSKAIEAKLLSPEQLQETSERVHDILVPNASLEPRVIELFGRIAGEKDWPRIAGWLDDHDTTVRAAAATAWAQSDQPLTELCKRADDVVIRPILIEAATRRGSDAETMDALVKRKPEQEQAVLAWQRCLVTMASRVPLSASLAADRWLKERNETAALREQLLSASIATLLPDVVATPATNPAATPMTQPVSMPSALIELILARGELRAQSDANQSQADFRRVLGATPAPSANQKKVAQWGLLQASLAAGDGSNAVAQAKALLAAAPGDTGVQGHVTEMFLATTQRSLETGQADAARKTLQQLQEVIGTPTPKTEMAQRVLELEDRAGVVRPSPATAPAPPASAPAEPTPPKG